MLKLENVSVNYGNVIAIENVSMELKEGETISIVGANGAGKSTTLKAISGLVKCRTGSIKLGDLDLTKMEPDRIVKEGIIQVPEGRRVFPQMSVLENIEMGATLRKDKSNIAGEIKEIFKRFPRLEERSKQMAGTLSGGEQQMLAIARGLIAKPKILMLDEPSLGLAPLIIDEIAKLILELKERGMTILLIEQNARMALKLSDRAYVLETGRVALEGHAQALLEDDFMKKAYLGA
ncbi:ABC transporter ATP-binding protein [Neobacillus niacini]|jgi:branched-chain amino acid transport system ATP-binding protein|uniref:ABC transporter ATP-binding protein n=1 Tax=Neobacillus niacini TaxID=86668 RepID=UPI001C8F06DB|nr:ABC transporter ATP-binding protein [Neobacillus niacini]MBY0149136.1 ABC transporter ATP-binding protein [Neobacillus niacini]